LRCGGPVMIVVNSDGTKVECSVSSQGVQSFDSEMLVLDSCESGQRTARELIEFARIQGVDFNSLCAHNSFFVEGRVIYWGRATTGGPVHYNMQGWIDTRLHSAGIRSETGSVDGIGHAFALSKAWLLDQTVLEELPSRAVRSWYGPRNSA
jgi:hypothetical protein